MSTSETIIQKIQTKYNIPEKRLQNLKSKLIECETKNQTLNDEIIDKLNIRNTLESYGILNLIHTIKEALSNPNFLTSTKPLYDLNNIYSNEIKLIPFNDNEYQYEQLKRLCYIYVNYKDYLFDNPNKKNISDTPNPIKLTHNIQFLMDKFMGSIEYQPEYKINWSYQFILNRLNKLLMKPNKLWYDFLNERSYRKASKLPKYKSFIESLNFHHYLISTFDETKTIVNNEKNPNVNAFSQSLTSTKFTSDITYEELFEPEHENYFLNIDACDRQNGYYRRLVFDIDINNNQFELPKFVQDLQFIVDYVLKPINDIQIYYAIDIANHLNSQLILNSLENIINNDTNKTHEHIYKYWIIEQKKDISIHIYINGVCFNEYSLFGFSKYLRDLIKQKYIFYIDPAPYHTGTQQMRKPFSGKLIAGRKPILRFENNDEETKLLYIEFYKHCHSFASIDEPYCNLMDCFYEYQQQPKSYTVKKAVTVKEIDMNSKIKIFSEFNKDLFYNSELTQFSPIQKLLLTLQISIINQTFGYQEHRRLRLIFLNNLLAFGANINDLLFYDKELKIHHTDGSITENMQIQDDCQFVIKSNEKYIFNHKIFYQDGKPITFSMTPEIQKILFHTQLTIPTVNIIANIYFAYIGYKKLFYKTLEYDEQDNQYAVKINGPFTNNSDMPTFKFNIWDGEKIVSISPLNLFKSPSFKFHNYNNIGFSNHPEYFNIYPLIIPQNKLHTNFDLLFQKIPELYSLLKCILENDNYEENELTNRIEYLLKSIIYAIQNPSKLKPKAIILITPQSSGKSRFLDFIKATFNEIVLCTKSLDSLINDQFNGYMMNKVIVSAEEISDTVNYDKLKAWIDQSKYSINQKNKDQIDVPNTSLKMFATNNKDFRFITKQERRFVVFESNIYHPKHLVRPYVKLLNDMEYRTESINYFRDYILHFDLKNFNPFNESLIPLSCKETFEAMAENTTNTDTYKKLFINQIFISSNCMIDKKSKKSILTIENILAIIQTIKNNLYSSYDDLSNNDKIIFKSDHFYEQLKTFYKEHFSENDKWNQQIIRHQINNNQDFDTHGRYRLTQLIIPEIWSTDKKQLNAIKYLL